MSYVESLRSGGSGPNRSPMPLDRTPSLYDLSCDLHTLAVGLDQMRAEMDALTRVAPSLQEIWDREIVPLARKLAELCPACGHEKHDGDGCWKPMRPDDDPLGDVCLCKEG